MEQPNANTRHNGFRHLTTASELQSHLNDLQLVHMRLLSVLRAASRIEDSSKESCSDMRLLIDVAVDLAQSADEQSESAEEMAGDVSQRLEGKPEPGDRLQEETLAQMFEALARRGEGFSAFRLAELASILRAHAEHAPDLAPAFDTWIAWMSGLGIETAIDTSVERAWGNFSVGVTRAPGGADAVIGHAAHRGTTLKTKHTGECAPKGKS